jgi:hypothetical protein
MRAIFHDEIRVSVDTHLACDVSVLRAHDAARDSLADVDEHDDDLIEHRAPHLPRQGRTVHGPQAGWDGGGGFAHASRTGAGSG